jgi:hypothetical protein
VALKALFSLLLACLLFGSSRAHADTGSPVRVAIECEGPGRTKACPAFLLGFVDANKVLLASPRAGADVLVYATATQFALVDRMHLRFVGRMEGAPPVVELDVELDTRASDDEQRAQLAPAFLRGIALFVAARHPEAVAVTLTAPADVAKAGAKVGSPWGFMVEIAGNGNYTKRYRSASGNLNIIGRWITRKRRALGGVFSNAGLNRQPPLMLDDGTLVSLDTNTWFIRPGAEYIQLLNEHWSTGIGSYTNFEDPKGQFKYSNRTRAALEWDRYPSDDPRGNRLGVFYSLGWVTERYRVRNELGETFATYPVHGISAVGSMRFDTLSLALEMELEAQLLRPMRRRSLTVSPQLAIKIGDHVDVGLTFTLTQRELPAPDMTALDPSDYAQISRLSYAEPLSLAGSLNLTFHWDPTNGVRNDRIESI